MIEQRDEELSRIYRDADGPRPPQRVDDNILAASQRVAGPRRAGFAHRWGVPVALAATVLVTSTLALMVYERQSGLDATAPQVPRAGRPEKVSSRRRNLRPRNRAPGRWRNLRLRSRQAPRRHRRRPSRRPRPRSIGRNSARSKPPFRVNAAPQGNPRACPKSRVESKFFARAKK